MIKKIGYFFTLICLVLLFENKANATHIMGADLSFKCLSNDTIEFNLSLYRDCSPGSSQMQGSYDIIISSSCFNSSVTVFQVGNAIEVSPLCPLQISNSTCNGGTLPGVQQYKYTGKIHLPTPCSDYLFYWESCCRNGAITNIFDPLSTGVRVEATWNKTQAGCDNSPAFSALPVPYICQGQLVNYNNGGYDPDGDSLVYTLVTPLSSSTATQVFQYNSPFNAAYPLTTPSGTVGFNPGTGQITMTASNLEITCLAVRIEEYRNDTLIGSVMRDIQVVVLNCNNLAPEQVLNNFENLQGGVITGPNVIEVCPGSTMSFDVFSHDPDGNNLSLFSNIATVLNGGTYTVTQFSADSAKVHVVWTPSGIDTGNYVITVTMNDDACPVYGQAAYSFVINVPASTYAGPDISLCWPDTVAQLIVTGGSIFSWTPSTGLSDTSIYNPIAIPGVTTTYYVESDLSSNCKNMDTITVFVLPALVLNPISDQDTVCAGDQIHLFSGISGGGGAGYNVNWNSIGTPFNSTQTNPFANPTVPTTYYLNVSSGSCQQNDSVFVFARPVPSSNFTLAPSNLCPLQTTIVNYPGTTTGLLNNWSFGNANVISGSGWGPYNLSWNNAGVKPVYLQVTDLTGCTSKDTLYANVHPNPTANFTGAPTEGCNPLEVFFTNQSSGGDSTYTWVFGNGGSSSDENPSNVYSNSGDFDVTLIATTYWGCKDTITKSDFVHVIDHVTASFTTTAISGQEYDISQANFNFTNTSQFADNYLWLFGDGGTSTEIDPIHSYTNVGTYTVTLVASNEYCTDTFTFSTIVVVSWNDIVFPTGFSPNEDGKNDFFKELFNKGVVTLNYKIYNRWGGLVFETSDPKGVWNGKLNGEDCEVGVYIWEANATMLNGNNLFKKGNVTLLR